MVPEAAKILRKYMAAHPEENGVAEILADAEVFLKGWKIHTERGLPETNHFVENDKAIGLWWTIQDDSPLYWKGSIEENLAAGNLFSLRKGKSVAEPVVLYSKSCFEQIQPVHPDGDRHLC